MAEKDRDEDGAKGGLEGDGGIERESGNGKGKRKKAESRILGGRENRFRKKEKIQNEFLHQRAESEMAAEKDVALGVKRVKREEKRGIRKGFQGRKRLPRCRSFPSFF
ncbi:hypothetical protein RUM43_010950 [Polyplax serrata]|uniref:Uncharacterized protein n=1 Tax=Polyplax serrata TaxID=468196 RepID=A0AAN8RZL0_POLSC